MPTVTLETADPAKELGQRERSKRERKDRITLAARKLFAEQGYDATTLRQIATAAGLGLGTLFNYVSDKRDLIYLVWNEEIDMVTDQALARPRSWQSFQAKIMSLAEPFFRAFAGEPVLARILLSEILLQSPGLNLERYYEIRDRWLKGMEVIIAQAQDAGEIGSLESAEVIARHLFFSFSAALRWWLASSPDPDWRTGQRELARIFHLSVYGLQPADRAASGLDAKHPRTADTGK